MARGLQNHAGGSFDGGVQGDILQTWPLSGPPTILTGTADAINPYNPNGNNYIITTGSADSTTLVAPVKTVDDGLCIAIYSGSAQAHTITSTGNLATGDASKTGVLTLASANGAGVILRAYQGKWQIICNNLATLTS